MPGGADGNLPLACEVEGSSGTLGWLSAGMDVLFLPLTCLQQCLLKKKLSIQEFQFSAKLYL